MFAPYRPGQIFFLLTRARENSTIPFFRHTEFLGKSQKDPPPKIRHRKVTYLAKYLLFYIKMLYFFGNDLPN